MEEYEDDFKKIFTFNTSDHCVLPNKIFESPKWTIPESQTKKEDLNRVKSLLSKYKLKVWTKHTANRDKAGFVMKHLSESIKPELLTQAWCKFYEILSQFPVVPIRAIGHHKLESLHLCEAPGAFVCALNHYLSLNYAGLEWDWIGSTLNPYYEGNELCQMIPDDRFIKHTFSKWNFGVDSSGDITKYHNHKHLVNYCNEYNKISLVTADGSVDCMKDPGEQERHVEHLHFCETMTALSVLQTGGAFVLKIFTMFEESTINLLYLLNCLFEKVAVFKPCTSKSGNSEVYVVCTKFKGFPCLQNVWAKISMVYQDKKLYSSHSMFYLNEISQYFLDEIGKCADFFMKKQIRTILDNIYHFENRTHQDVYMTKSFVAFSYINKYELKSIPEDKKIVPNVNVGEDWGVHSPQKYKSFYKLHLERLIKPSKLFDILQLVIGEQISTVNHSKFTHSDNVMKLPEIFGKTERKLELYHIILNLLSFRNIVINAKDFHLLSFHKFHKDLFQKLQHSLHSEKNLIFINIPFVTHFLVGLLYILFFMFDEIYFGNGIIILYGPKPRIFLEVKALFSRIQSKYQDIDKQNLNCDFYKDIVQIVSPTLLAKCFWIDNIWNYNNRLLCHSYKYYGSKTPLKMI